MPALWQSSQRPMYVRTVWVDGFRHAILTQDDPYLLKATRKRRPHSSASCASKAKVHSARLSQHGDNLEDCLRKLNLVIRSDRPKIVGKPRPKSSHEPQVEKLDLSDIEQESEEEFVLKANSQPLYEFESSRSKNNFCLNMKTIKSSRTARSDNNEDTELSERVLQWLDLAGKVDLLAPGNVERMNHPRHSWPEIQKKNQCFTKSKTTLDLRTKEGNKMCLAKDIGTVQQNIDRHDFYVPTSANTIENYARQSRNVKNTPRNEANPKTKDNFKTKNKDMRANVQETRQKMVMELSAMEKQYEELVSKKIIPDVGKSTKKQVHIFMPEAITKKFDSTSTSRTESLMSQRSSMK